MDIEEKNIENQYKKPNLSITPYNVKVQKLRYDVILSSAGGVKVDTGPTASLGEIRYNAVQSGYVEPPPNCRGCIIACKQFVSSKLTPESAEGRARALGIRLKNAAASNSLMLTEEQQNTGISPASILCWCPLDNVRLTPATPPPADPFGQYYNYQCNTDPVNMGIYCPNILSHYDIVLVDEYGLPCNQANDSRDEYVLHLVIQYLVDDYSIVQ